MAGAPGLGMLAALGGAGAAQGPDAGTGAPNPDELLSQIRALLEQYLALGGDTPVAAQAQALASAIDGNAGGTADAGAAPEGSAAEEAAESPAEEGAEGDEAPDADDPLHAHDPEAYSGGSMSKARDGAKAFLRKQNKKGAKA